MFNIQPLKQEQSKKTPKRTNKIKSSQLLGIPYYLLLIVLIIIPLVLILFYAVLVKEENMFYRFTLQYFKEFFVEQSYLKTLASSISLAVITTLICLFLGYPLAYIASKLKAKRQTLIILLVTAPMWINMLILTYAWKQLFEMLDPVVFGEEFISKFGLGSNFAIVIGMVNIFLPFMIIPIYSVLSKIDPHLYEASADLGASGFKTFMKVTLPLSLGGVLSGITMVLLPAATTIVIPKILGKGKYMIGTLIEDRFFNAGNWGQGSAIGLILSVIIMVLMFLTKKADKTRIIDKDEEAKV